MAVYTLLCWMHRPAHHTGNYKYTVQCNKLTRRYSRNTEERPTFILPQLGKMLKSGWSKRLTPTQWSVDCKMRVFWFERQGLLCDQVSKHREMMNLAVSIIPMQSQPLSQLFLRNPLSSRQSQTFFATTQSLPRTKWESPFASLSYHRQQEGLLLQLYHQASKQTLTLETSPRETSPDSEYTLAFDRA